MGSMLSSSESELKFFQIYFHRYHQKETFKILLVILTFAHKSPFGDFFIKKRPALRVQMCLVGSAPRI